MAVIVGSFGTQTQVEDATNRLKEAGFGDGDLSVVSHADDPVGGPMTPSQEGDRATEAAAAGGIAGAILGGALLGPIGAILGGAAGGGGLAALLRDRGVTGEDAEEYEARLRQGRYVLAVDTGAQGSEQTVRSILEAAGADRVAAERESA